MVKLHEHTAAYRVYTEDTDLMGVVYHANYLRFFERARSEMLREHGLSLTMMATYDTYFTIYRADTRFLYPARLDDMVTIKSTCVREKTCSLLFRQVMMNQLDRVLCESDIQAVCVNEKLRPKKLPESFSQIVN